MRLPEVAEELRELAKEYDIPRLLELADEIKRRPSMKGERVSKKITPDIRHAVKAIKRKYPNIAQITIAKHLGINQGRVSEILKGKRT